MTDIFPPKSAENFNCVKCDYICSKASDWRRHILTRKHQNTDKILTNTDAKRAKRADTPADTGFPCECGKNYKHRQSLFNHKKKCAKNKTQMLIDIIKEDKHVQEFLMEQNKQLIEKLTEQNKTLIEQNTKLFEYSQKGGIINTNVNNNINNHNKFNINVFLNETCKNALNLSDFVNQMNVTLTDLENTSRVGYAEGISQVFIKNLTDIDYTQRPIHCNDYKRETLYIKDDNKWTKDGDNRDKLTNAIKIVASKNMKQIPEWQKANPDYLNPESKQNDKYMKMICEVMSGSTKEEQQKNYSKIIKNITREVLIEKNVER